MIEIYLTNLITEGSLIKAGNGKDIKIRITGHSGYAKKNSDIVCAGVSAVVQTAVIGITKAAGIRQKLKQKDGFLESKIEVKKLSSADFNNLIIILNTMLAGLNEIHKQYPEALKVNINHN